MRALVLSDIHANIDALDAVLAKMSGDAYDLLLVLGDLVGYGASPNEVVDRVYALAPDVVIRGNHDKVAAGIEEPAHFNPIAAEAARWTYETLSESNRTCVAELPVGPVQVTEEIEICHGTPYDEDVYVFDHEGAISALASARGRLCFFGHTHIPVVFSTTSNLAELDVVTPQIGRSGPDRHSARPRPAVSHQPGFGRTTARRRPQSRVQESTIVPRAASSCVGYRIESIWRKRRSPRQGCLTHWRGGWGWGGRNRESWVALKCLTSHLHLGPRAALLATLELGRMRIGGCA